MATLKSLWDPVTENLFPLICVFGIFQYAKFKHRYR